MEQPTDTELLDFLESLMGRVDHYKRIGLISLDTDIHITGSESCSIYVRDLIGDTAAQGHGKTVRAAIKEVLAEVAKGKE